MFVCMYMSMFVKPLVCEIQCIYKNDITMCVVDLALEIKKHIILLMVWCGLDLDVRYITSATIY
ncbi:hypothetical protein HanIR_Chr14g0685141 [Helianthus annuus]|nr:hypothetical protein HanIR_Chr14g0685141 [Helianthus annuus]